MQPSLTQELGQRIKNARKRCGINQETLAHAIGVTKSTISKYELGLREPSFEQLCKIANFLHAHPAMLMTPTMQRSFFAGYNTALQTDRYKAALQREDADEVEAAEFDMIDMLHYFNQLNGRGQRKAIDKLIELCDCQEYRMEPPQD